ncbi:MAG: hypothetical protein MUF87_12050 [Anaerolineae bacterium]|jgi:hypothetical protein|nr:hypothetical protein [Anaerolineae bacterium]
MSNPDPEGMLQRIEARFTRRIWYGLHLLGFVAFGLLTLLVARRFIAPLAVWAFLIMAHTIVFVLLESRDLTIDRFFQRERDESPYDEKAKNDVPYEDYFDDEDNHQNRRNLN